MNKPIIKNITSKQNVDFRNLQKILRSVGIRKLQQFAYFGEKQLNDLLGLKESPHKDITRPNEIEIVYVVAAENQYERAIKLAEAIPGVQILLLDKRLFNQIDTFDTRYPFLVCKALSLQLWSGDISSKGLDLFLPIQDPGNLGTTIRSAAALGAKRIILLRECCSPMHPKCVRAAGPMLFALPLLLGPSLSELLAKSDLPLALLTKEGDDILNIANMDRLGLVAGIEGPGFSLAEHASYFYGKQKSFTITMENGSESLNVSAAVAIALFCHGRRYQI